MGCLNCSKDVHQTAGKRKRDFCNSTCRSNYWQKQNRKKSSQKTNLKDLTENTFLVKPLTADKPKTNFTINTVAKDAPPIPERMPGEHPIDFAGRKNEWKKLYGTG